MNIQLSFAPRIITISWKFVKIDANEIQPFWGTNKNATLILKISASFFLSLKWLNFICIYFHEFLQYDNDFWCKRKLNIHTLRCKSFLPPSLVFYPLFLHRRLTENRIWACKLPIFKAKKGGKKLVEGGKKLLHLLEQHLSFHLHQESLPYF